MEYSSAVNECMCTDVWNHLGYFYGSGRSAELFWQTNQGAVKHCVMKCQNCTNLNYVWATQSSPYVANLVSAGYRSADHMVKVEERCSRVNEISAWFWQIRIYRKPCHSGTETRRQGTTPKMITNIQAAVMPNWCIIKSLHSTDYTIFPLLMIVSTPCATIDMQSYVS